MKIRKIGARLLVYIGALAAFSILSYAGTLGDSLSEGMISINNFFESNQYEAYASIIDFMFFTLLFVSVYLIGARYGFKQLSKPEKTIAFLLGVLTAFLLVSSGFSIGNLIPYVNWILYFLLFLIIWFVLKGIHSKFWRFVATALILLLIIALLSGYFEDLTVIPEEEVIE
ncbi:hypothetical protein HY637_00610 [Candidatus Woesearchaeota archaeon]|nr:hypothetical protein [Candidatus Woesearchaeota archaeon]